jgi:lipid A 3-O-deacylase
MAFNLRLAAAALGLLFVGTPVCAADLFGGIYKHNVPFASKDTHEKGADFQLGYRFNSVLDLGPLLHFQPYLLGSVNSAGDTSFAAAGLSLKFGGPIYVRPGVGIAVHTGPSYRVDSTNTRTDLGSRVLFEPEFAIGMMVAPRVSLEASWTHLSHAQIFGGQNPGVDMVGARINLHLP